MLCLYNPASHSRPDHLRRACDILLAAERRRTRSAALCRTSAGGESAPCLRRLAALRDTKVDMFTTVFIGSSQTRVLNGKMVTPRGYLQREN